MPAKIDLTTFNCSLARALAVVGDGWSLLIVRDAWLGLTRFGELRRSLGVAKNILAARLDQLVAGGVLERAGTDTRPTYHLTASGRELLPALVALMQWGDKWMSGGVPPMRLTGPNGAAVLPIELRTADATLDAAALQVEAGAGADARTRTFLAGRAKVPSP